MRYLGDLHIWNERMMGELCLYPIPQACFIYETTQWNSTKFHTGRLNWTLVDKWNFSPNEYEEAITNFKNFLKSSYSYNELVFNVHFLKTFSLYT
jgi:hypothetical protein